MNKEYALSFCDNIFPGFDEDRWQKEIDNNSEINRVYIGSNFCENFFLRYRFFDWKSFGGWVKQNDIAVSLVIPIVREASIFRAQEIVDSIASRDYIDEIVVNDVGMLEYVKEKMPQKRRLLGRLFFKNTRDVRNLFRDESEKVIISAFIKELIKEYEIFGIEADTIGLSMDFGELGQNILVSYNKSWTYLTVGRMCAFAAAGLDDKDKFIADVPCKLQCIGNPIFYNHERGLIVKSGKAVYCAALPSDVYGTTCVRTIIQVTEWEQKDE